MIGYAFCGSFCTHRKSFEVFSSLIEKQYDLLPIFSENAYKTDTRFGSAAEFVKKVEAISGHECIHTVAAAEPLGPKQKLDALIIAPCTGNTLAKMANGITDTSVTMAAKAHLRSGRPLVIALASNDALSANLKNIAEMLNRKSVFFVPMVQDDPLEKPYSLVCDMSLVFPTLEMAMRGEQYRKIFL